MNHTKEMPSANSGGHGFPDGKRRTRNDLILIGGLLGALIIGALLFFLLGKEGAYAVVTVNGEELGVYPLSNETVVEIRTGEDREDLNREDLACQAAKVYGADAMIRNFERVYEECNEAKKV